jgi:hypothetical protein
LITYAAKDPDTKFPPIEQLRPPKGAPNVLIILLDDVGGLAMTTPTRAERLTSAELSPAAIRYWLDDR